MRYRHGAEEGGRRPLDFAFQSVADVSAEEIACTSYYAA